MTITATVTTPLVPVQYRVRVISPELDLSQSDISQKNFQATARAEATGSGGAGSAQTHVLEVLAPSEGAYTYIVVVDVVGQTQRPDAANSAQATVWADVREEGGEAVPDIHARWVEDANLLTLGPVGPDGHRGIVAANPVGDVGMSTSSEGSAFSTIHVVYLDNITGTYRPVPNVKVAAHNNGAGGTTSYTDAQGNASVVCTPSGTLPGYTLGVAYTEGSSKVRVYRDPNWFIPWNESTTAATFVDPPCGATGYVTLNADMALMYVTLQRAAQEYESYFGQSRNLVEAYLNPNDDKGYYYNHVTDNIVVQDDCLNSTWGFDALAHEYGHAFHTKALGDFAHGTCGDDHHFRECQYGLRLL